MCVHVIVCVSSAQHGVTHTSLRVLQSKGLWDCRNVDQCQLMSNEGVEGELLIGSAQQRWGRSISKHRFQREANPAVTHPPASLLSLYDLSVCPCVRKGRGQRETLLTPLLYLLLCFDFLFSVLNDFFGNTSALFITGDFLT